MSFLPLEIVPEYEAACEHFARTGRLPDCMGSPGALDYIQDDPESFEHRVKDYLYAAAMEKVEREAAECVYGQLDAESRV